MATYESAIPYIQKAEGGLSRATTDTASGNPSPYVYKGVTGWHTNRGIIWPTFKTMAPRVGYEINQENFINMPDKIWLGIYKVGFWDDMKGDLYKSQPVANAIVDFAWASGGGGARRSLIKYLATKGIKANDSTSIANAFNTLVEKEGENKVFNDLIDERKRFFKSLNQPANEKGWLNRMETLRKQGLSLIVSGVTTIKKNPIPTAIITVLLLVSTYVLVNQFKK
jgi:lysozyme family protein